MLSDSQIKYAVHWGDIEISNFNEDRLQPSSYDVTLGATILELNDRDPVPLDPKVDTTDQFHRVDMDETGHVLRFGKLILATTTERIKVGRHAARVEGKSSLGRLGVGVHVTAGFIDPGFDGQVTLELFCPHPRGVRLYPGMPVGQLAFFPVNSVEVPYHGKYVDQEGPQPSLFHQNWLGDGWK